MVTKEQLTIFLKDCQTRVNKTLVGLLPSIHKEPKDLHEAMSYAVLNGGKRLRPALLYATGKAFNAPLPVLDQLSAAVEMIHAFSLVHDDLPAIDNDTLRRGNPTCHIAYGEATAILAGDALQALGLETIANIQYPSITPENNLKMTRLLAAAIGSKGLIGGEELDTKMINKRVSTEDLEVMYHLKTGCLIKASILLGAFAANCQDQNIIENLSQFADYLGLAFQIHDDIIGIESDTELLGKTQGADLTMHKPVYPVVVGMSEAKKIQQNYFEKALDHLEQSGIDSSMLEAIAGYIVRREY